MVDKQGAFDPAGLIPVFAARRILEPKIAHCDCELTCKIGDQQVHVRNAETVSGGAASGNVQARSKLNRLI